MTAGKFAVEIYEQNLIPEQENIWIGLVKDQWSNFILGILPYSSKIDIKFYKSML